MSSAITKHPDELEILRLLDGELPEAEARQVQRHLEGCWQCRTDRNETEAAIDAFVRYREKVLLAGMAPPPNRWPDLRARCEAFDAAHAAPARQPWPVWRLVAAGTVGLALLGVTIALRDRPVPVEKKVATAGPPRTLTPKPADPVRTASPAPRTERPLLAEEVEVWERLHAAGADLGEPVEVEATDTEIRVKIMALEPGRTAALRRALGGLERTRLIEREPPVAQQTGTEAGSAVTPRPILFGARLRSQLGSDAAREEFANTALDMGESIMARVYALHRLESRFAGKPLAPREAAAMDRMRQDHRDVLRRQAAELRKLLASVFPEEPAAEGTPGTLERTARVFEEAISAAFAGAQSRHSDAELLRELQGSLRELAQ